MITTLVQSASDTQTMFAWTAWLAVVGNLIAVCGGIAVLGRYIKKWILRTASDVVAPVRHTAERAEKLAKQNRDDVRTIHQRVDAVWSRIGG